MTACVLTGARLATMRPDADPYGLIDTGAVALAGGEISWVGPAARIPPEFQDWPRENLEGRLVTPGLIDCHTHLVHGGDRAREFEMRLTG
ncbi:MAG: imidazolonepropionase, partial [Pseudomonadota bacterium]